MKHASIFILLAFLFFSCNPMEEINPMGGDDDDNTMGQATEDEAPGFSLTNLNGQSVSLDDFEDKIVVLYFFGSGCPFCIAAGPDVQKMADGFASNEKFAIIGLDTWDGNQSAVESFMDRAKVNFDLLLDASSVAKAYSTTYDRIVIVDTSDGSIAYKGTQRVSNELSDIEKKINELLD